MGCWNSTDFVTSLPILGGDKCKLLLLIETSKSSIYYSNIIPRAVPITGIYNEYGSLEKIKDSLNNNFIIDQFKQDLVGSRNIKSIQNVFECLADSELVIDENYSKRQKAKEYLNLLTSTEALINDDYSGIFSKDEKIKLQKEIDDCEIKPSKIHSVLILESVYNKLANYNFKLNKKPFKEILLNDAYKFLNEIGLKKSKNKNVKLFKLEKALVGRSGNLFLDFLYNKDILSCEYYSKYLENMIINHGFKIKDKAIISFVNDIVDFICFNKALVALRKEYYIPKESGSQESNYKIHEALAKVVLDQCKLNMKSNYSYDD